jgi:hypothetical protein
VGNVAPIQDPYPVFDIQPLETGLAEVIPILEGGSLDALTAVSPVGVIAMGVQVDNYLLNQPWWNNFWIGVGGHLTDVWHAAGSFLFGTPSNAPSLDTVSQLIQLSMHVVMRSTRQIVGVLSAHTATITARLYHAVISIEQRLNGLTGWAVANFNAAHAFTQSQIYGLENYVRVNFGGLAGSIDARIGAATSALRAEMLRDILNPMHSEIDGLGRTVTTLNGEIHGVANYVGTHVVPELAGTAALAGAAFKLAQLAESFVNDCGEPMCQVIGPKTNWGKLFARFSGVALLALLAGLETEDPHLAEKAAEDFAAILGPIMQDWVEGWIGLTQSDTKGDVTKIGGDVGNLPLN